MESVKQQVKRLNKFVMNQASDLDSFASRNRDVIMALIIFALIFAYLHYQKPEYVLGIETYVSSEYEVLRKVDYVRVVVISAVVAITFSLVARILN